MKTIFGLGCCAFTALNEHDSAATPIDAAYTSVYFTLAAQHDELRAECGGRSPHFLFLWNWGDWLDGT